MIFDKKLLRKKVKEVVAEYKKSMMGRYTIVDAGGRKWSIEYDILYWRSDWEEWDYYCSGGNQYELFSELNDALIEIPIEKCGVNVVLKCNGKDHTEKIFYLDGSSFDKYKNV